MTLDRQKLAVAFALLGGLLLGRYLLPDPASGLTGLPPEVVEAIRSGKLNEASPSSGNSTAALPRRRDGHVQTQVDPIPHRVGQTLALGDTVARVQQVTSDLQKMDASNWKQVIDQFEIISHQTGRTHPDLWKLAMMRVGQVAGAAGIEDIKARGFEQDQVFYGWAMADPAAAQAWFEEKGHEDPHALQFRQQLVEGMAVADPAKAMSYFATLSESDQQSCATDLVNGLVRTAGVDAASQWLDQVLASGASQGMSKRAFDEVAQLVAKTSKPDVTGLGFAQDWFLRYKDSPYITSEEIGTAASRFQGQYALNGLDFLMTMNQLPVVQGQSDNPPGLAQVMQNAYAHDPQKLEKWLQQNATAPFSEQASQIYASLRDKPR